MEQEKNIVMLQLGKRVDRLTMQDKVNLKWRKTFPTQKFVISTFFRGFIILPTAQIGQLLHTDILAVIY